MKKCLRILNYIQLAVAILTLLLLTAFKLDENGSVYLAPEFI